MNKVSVIIPVYNAENYIAKCLNSIVEQTLKDIEIICVDDGSWDKSLEICKNFARKDNRIKVFTKENSGIPSTRNVGLRHANAEYITFIDADDWIEPEMYEQMYAQAVKNNADIAVIGYSKDRDGEVRNRKNLQEIPQVIEDKEQLIRYAFIRDCYMNYGAYVWNKLFKKELILGENPIFFDEMITRGEDVLFYAQTALKSKRVTYSDECLYHYVQRGVSYTKTITLEQGEGILNAYQRVIELCDQAKITNETIQWLKRFYAYHASILTERAIKCNEIEKILKYKECVKKYLKEYLDTNRQYPERIERINWLLNYE